MSQRSIDFYLKKSANKRKIKISSDEDDSPKESITSKKRPKIDNNNESTKKKKIKSESVAVLFGGQLKRECKQKSKNSPEKWKDRSDSKYEQVSDTSFSTPTKSDNRSPPLRRSSRTPRKASFSVTDNMTQQKDASKKTKNEKIECKNSTTPKKQTMVKNQSFKASNMKISVELLQQEEITPVRTKSVGNSTMPIDHYVKSKQAPHVKRRLNEPDLEKSILSDEERFERKRMAAMLYQKRQNRETVLNPGSKQAPKGAPNCLLGLSFCITGVLESFTREEAAEIVKNLGGKLSVNVGKRLNYLIAGEDAGPKKLSDAESLNIPIISLDGLFEIIKEYSNKKPKGETKISPRQKKIEQNSSSKVLQDDTISPKKIKKENQTLHPNLKFPISLEDKNAEGKSKTIKTEDLTVGLADEAELLKNNIGPSTANQIINDNNITWVEKYKPTSLKQIVGQQGAASNCVKLINWLKNWHHHQNRDKKNSKPNPWAKNDDGSCYKAALLSGPPGVGKTTTALLVCKEVGYDIVEFNASDTRSKRLLKEEVSELLSNKSLYEYFHGNLQTVSKKHVLIMDEVDGMAGNEDRGGIQELIALIKDSHIPIICMCNDRNHQKMRSLVNYCFDLRFTKPRLEQIKGFVKSICFKEKIKLSSVKIDEIILATNNDIRQSINHLYLLSAGEEIKQISNTEKTAKKDLKMGSWEVVRKVFSAEEHKHMSMADKLDLFFHDYSMAPLFVQQNYLMVSPAGPKSQVLKKVAISADALSLGDLVDRRIRTNSAWSLLPVQAVFSSYFPGEYMEGHFTGQINFPSWLGKFSKTNKRSRLAQEIHDHTRLRTSGSRLSIRMDYAPFLLSHIVRPLQEKAMQGVEESLKVIQEYRLLREDIDSLIELTTWPRKKNPMDAVEGRVKAALTRSYNKEILPYSYSATTASKKRKTETVDSDMDLELMEHGNEIESVESDEENDSLEYDNLIKAKKGNSTATKASSSKSKKHRSLQKTS